MHCPAPEAAGFHYSTPSIPPGLGKMWTPPFPGSLNLAFLTCGHDSFQVDESRGIFSTFAQTCIVCWLNDEEAIVIIRWVDREGEGRRHIALMYAPRMLHVRDGLQLHAMQYHVTTLVNK